jgi:hypothetical protein
MAVIRVESETPRSFHHCVITGICSLIPLLGIKIIYLADRTDLFKISNLVWGGKEMVTGLYCKHL